MTAKRVIGIFTILSLFIPMAFSQDNRVMCEVVENNKSVTVKFGEDIKYLGSDYTKQIGLYDDKNYLKFDTAIEVVSYLCSHWGWKQCGNPTYKDKGKTRIYTLEHKIDNVLPNLWRQIEILNEYERSIKKEKKGDKSKKDVPTSQ